MDPAKSVGTLDDGDAQQLCDDLKRYQVSQITDADAYLRGSCVSTEYEGWDYYGLTIDICKKDIAQCIKTGGDRSAGLIETCYWMKHRSECPDGAGTVGELAACLGDWCDEHVIVYPKFASMTCEQIQGLPKNGPNPYLPSDRPVLQSCAKFLVKGACPVINFNDPKVADAGRD